MLEEPETLMAPEDITEEAQAAFLPQGAAVCAVLQVEEAVPLMYALQEQLWQIV
jgi:hypothetical protein